MISVKHLRKGSYMIHNNEPCLVKEAVSVVTGTHTHTKVKISFQGIFSGVNDSVTLPPHDSVEDAEIVRKEGQVISMIGNKIQLMDVRTYEIIDAEAEEAMLKELSEGDSVTFIDFKGRIKLLEKR